MKDKKPPIGASHASTWMSTFNTLGTWEQIPEPLQEK